MRVSACDVYGFHPALYLVKGPISDIGDLIAVERFVRTAVLHDEMVLELEPFEDDIDDEGPFSRFQLNLLLGEISVMLEAAETQAGSFALVAGAPGLAGFDCFMRDSRDEPIPEIELSPELMEKARLDANALQFDARVKYLKRMIGRVNQGGSVLICGGFGKNAIEIAEKYPETLFHDLDEHWKRYAEEMMEDGLGLLIPPVLGIVLSRAASREAIPIVIRDLRDEWAEARTKVWTLLDALRTARTLGEATSIRRELSESSKLFAPQANDADSRPIRVLWELIAAAAAGAGIAVMSGGKPLIGATAGTITQAVRSVPALVHEFGGALFGRGAFDLARRIRREVAKIDIESLPRLLTEAERKKLGFS
jgi:hypothetical protein